MKNIIAITILLLLTISYSCDFGNKLEKDENELIENYLNSIGDTVYTKTASGLYYLTISEGDGRTPVIGDTVFMWYKGKMLSGQLFDTNIDQAEPFGFIVGSGSVISGLDEGVKLMKDGGKAKFITPSSLAYGPAGLYGYNSYGYYQVIIPGYTPLVWDIEIDTVRAGTK